MAPELRFGTVSGFLQELYCFCLEALKSLLGGWGLSTMKLGFPCSSMVCVIVCAREPQPSLVEAISGSMPTKLVY